MPKKQSGQADVLVWFGCTGDLGHKMTFPALYAMARHGHLTVPIIGVAYSNWTLLGRWLHRYRAAVGVAVVGVAILGVMGVVAVSRISGPISDAEEHGGPPPGSPSMRPLT